MLASCSFLIHLYIMDNQLFLPFENISIEDRIARVSFGLTAKLGELLLIDSTFRTISKRAYIEAAIQYANLASQVDGYRIEQKDGSLVGGMLASDFTHLEDSLTDRLYIVRDNPITRRYGEALLRIANEQNCYISEVIMNGLSTHFEASSYRDLGYSVVAMKDDARTLLLSTV